MLDDAELERRLYGSTDATAGSARPLPDPAYIHTERSKPGVTLELLHLEYLEKHPDGYRYTQFCEVYRRWLKRRRLSMRQVHRAGEKLFVDFSGKKPCIVDPRTGEVIEVELFVAVFGASNCTYAEATRTQQMRANIDYHVEVDGHYYSVPHVLRGEVFDVRTTATTVERFLRNERIDSYARSYERGRHTTRSEHMPKAHREHAEWSPSRLIRWAATMGPETAKLVEAILSERHHPEQGYRSCLGILRLSKKYGAARLEAACARAVAVRARSYRHVDSILRNGLDRVPLPAAETSSAPTATHENVRGRDYYH